MSNLHLEGQHLNQAFDAIASKAKDIVYKRKMCQDEEGVLYIYSENNACYKITRKETFIDAIAEEMGFYHALDATNRNQFIEAMLYHARKRYNELHNAENISISIFKNKVINLDSGIEYEPNDALFTLNCIPWNIKKGDPSKIIRFIESLGNKDLLIDIIAYSSINSNPLKLIYIFVGKPNTGKSTFASFMRRFLGEQSCTSTNLKLIADANARFEIHNLRGKLLVTASEIDGRGNYKTAQLKQISGNDLLRGELKGINGLKNFIFHGKLLILTNDMIMLDDSTDYAFMGRVLICDFLNQFSLEGINPLNDFSEEDLEAFSYIVYMRVKEWSKNKKIEIRGMGTFADRVKEFSKRSDPLGSFIKERCITDDPEALVPCYEFRDSFMIWQQQKGEKIWDEKRIGKDMKDKGFEHHQIKSGDKRMYYYRGLKLSALPYLGALPLSIPFSTCKKEMEMPKYSKIPKAEEQKILLPCNICGDKEEVYLDCVEGKPLCLNCKKTKEIQNELL